MAPGYRTPKASVHPRVEAGCTLPSCTIQPQPSLFGVAQKALYPRASGSGQDLVRQPTRIPPVLILTRQPYCGLPAGPFSPAPPAQCHRSALATSLRTPATASVWGLDATRREGCYGQNTAHFQTKPRPCPWGHTTCSLKTQAQTSSSPPPSGL